MIRAAYEEGKILWRRQPIAQYLEAPNVNDETQAKLKLVLEVREYARDRLDMKVGGSYASYSFVDRPDLSYVLTAAPKTELRPYTWWFLIVGRVPYKGYFSRQSAEEAAAELQARGYDTNIRSTAAFSTLGWFDDPLLSHLLRYDKVTLAEIVFHELFHNTLYLKGAGAFNESVATFVGNRAAVDFFREKFGEGSPEHRRALEAWGEVLEFSDFIQQLAVELTHLYDDAAPLEEKLRRREVIFARSRDAWSKRVEHNRSHRFRNFPNQSLNNAVIIHYLLYLRELKVFEALYEAEGRDLRGTIDVIRGAAAGSRNPFRALRRLVPEKERGPGREAGLEF